MSECSALALIRVGYFCEMFDPFSCLVLINKEARALDLLFQSAIVCVSLTRYRQTTIVNGFLVQSWTEETRLRKLSPQLFSFLFCLALAVFGLSSHTHK